MRVSSSTNMTRKRDGSVIGPPLGTESRDQMHAGSWARFPVNSPSGSARRRSTPVMDAMGQSDVREVSEVEVMCGSRWSGVRTVVEHLGDMHGTQGDESGYH